MREALYPIQYCVQCDAAMRPRRFPSGELEGPLAFQRRLTCPRPKTCGRDAWRRGGALYMLKRFGVERSSHDGAGRQAWQARRSREKLHRTQRPG